MPIRASYMALMGTLFLWAACTPSHPQKIHLFNEIYLNLKPQEQLVPLSQGHVDNYQLALANIKEQVPLYKVVKGPGYYLYLGKPLASLLTTLKADSSSWDSTQSTDAGFYARWEKKQQPCGMYYMDTPSKFLMVVVQEDLASRDACSFPNMSSRLTFKNSQ